ncbi:MAG: energy transducer TonB [Chitinophagaceae bacterium]|nr:MAG: energy transducer TonB [Chitinophagaceae bacterium]
MHMTSQQILHSDLLDILFEKRNKLYGAYLLRKNYPVELMKAIAITCVLTIALIFFTGSSSTKQTLDKITDGYKVSQVVIPEEPKPKLPEPASKPPASQVKTEVLTNDMKVVNETPEPLATQSDLDNSVLGNQKIDGDPAASGLQPPQMPQLNTGGTGTAEEAVEKKEPPLPSRQPQFPGGAQAWLNFLSRNLRPPQDMEAGEKRTCLIRFSVDEDGTITNFQVLQSGGNEFDNEVIRVLKKMPKWLPAIQNGKPAAVSFTQPVTFAAAEE